MKYDITTEYKVDINDGAIQNQLSICKNMFQHFSNKYQRKLDFEHTDSIHACYEAAKKMGIFQLAKEVRQLIFGKDLHFYGACYLWDSCVCTCTYCPASVDNREKTGYKTRFLTPDEAVLDTLRIMQDGHRHVCFLTGEDLKQFPAETMAVYLKKLDDLGLNEIILNIPVLTTRRFKTLRDAVKKTSLQFRVFQETYSRETYKKVHLGGPKKNYDFRIESQGRAIEAGFDNVGLGALLGLHRYPIEEILGLRDHADSLKRKYDVDPVRVALPGVHYVPDIEVTVPYPLKMGTYDEHQQLITPSHYEYSSELIYALAKLAMPHLSLVSSERDPHGLLSILDNYITCTNLNVHPSVGGNMSQNEVEDDVHFEQAFSFTRKPEKTLKDMRERGWNPLI